MSALGDIRQALADAIVAGTGGVLNQVSRAPVTEPTPPAAWLIRRGSEWVTNEGGTIKHTFDLRIVVGLSEDVASQDTLDGLTDPANPTSVYKALYADDTLGGLVEDIYVVEAGPDLAIAAKSTTAAPQYLAVDLTVEVYAPGV